MNISGSAVVYSVTNVSLHSQESDDNNNTFLIRAEGEVTSSGWRNPRLHPYTYVQPPVDGIWDFSFVADAPGGTSRPMLTPVSAEYVMQELPAGFLGVRVHGATNNVETIIR